MTQPAIDRPRPARMPGMDGLRALAAGSVLVFHVALYGLEGGTGHPGLDHALPHLGAGVLLFFTLSGVLLYAPFASAIAGQRSFPNIATFARNRLLRIVPAYWTVLVAAGVVFGVAVVPHATSVLETGSLLDHPRALMSNLLLVQGYDPGTLLTGIGPAWTLAIEVAFYATLPIVAWLTFAVAAGTRWRQAAVFLPPVAFLAVGLAGKVVTARWLDGAAGWERTWPSVAARSFLANADLFAAGMTVAAVAVLVDGGRLRLPRWWTKAALVGAGVLAIAAADIPHASFGVFRYDMLGALAAALVVSVLVVGDDRASLGVVRALEARPVIAVGVASYSLYLWHQPVIDWFRDRGVLPLSGVRGLAIGVVAVATMSGLLSTITYLAVERPALRKKRVLRPGRTERGSGREGDATGGAAQGVAPYAGRRVSVRG